MRERMLIACLAGSMALLCLSSATFAQDDGCPTLLSRQQLMTASGTSLERPTVIHTPVGYEMWFTGQYPLGYAVVMHTTSPDGITWSTPEPALVRGTGWESIHNFNASVIYEDGVYKAWYTGYGGGPNRIGYATSTDGTHWTKYAGNPVLSNGSWDGWGMQIGTVIHDQDAGLYRMWYSATTGWYGPLQVGYATSPDGIVWTKHAGPIFVHGSTIEWSNDHCCVIPTSNGYTMFFSSSDNTVGLAESTDGINWTIDDCSPLLGPTASQYDDLRTYAVSVLQEGGEWKMWYSGLGVTGDREIGYAVFLLDHTPPTITVSGLPSELWPPNHKMVRIQPTVTVSDNYDPSPSVTLTITSSEADDGVGDGHTTSDFIVHAADDFELRAERSGANSGRVYTLTWTATDQSGNSSTVTATVEVPKSNG